MRSEFEEFAKKIRRPVLAEKTVTTPSGKVYVLRELNGSQMMSVDAYTMPHDARGLAKRVSATVVSIDGVGPTDVERTILAEFGGLEMDELIRAYAEAFDPELVAHYEQTRDIHRRINRQREEDLGG